ncbi:MAG: nucleotidyltransferase domain-containing protein [Gammaproteobacteria bacterium]|nr:nucleotidyltransferase domain-containing protein [Gammaproteobacteria bacterium]
MALNTELIKQIARRHGVSKVRIFGSYLHGTQKDDSDIDLLIDLEPGRGLFDLVALKRDLEDEIGKHVDVVTEGALSPYMKEDVLREARTL